MTAGLDAPRFRSCRQKPAGAGERRGERGGEDEKQQQQQLPGLPPPRRGPADRPPSAGRTPVRRAGASIPGGSIHPPGRRAAYQGVEGGGLGAVGHVVSIALGPGVGAAVDPQGGGGVEFVSGGGEEAALVHRAIDGGLGGGGRPRLGQCPAAGLAAGRQGVGAHQELEGKESGAEEGDGGEEGGTSQTVSKFRAFCEQVAALGCSAPPPPPPSVFYFNGGKNALEKARGVSILSV